MRLSFREGEEHVLRRTDNPARRARAPRRPTDERVDRARPHDLEAGAHRCPAASSASRPRVEPSALARGQHRLSALGARHSPPSSCVLQGGSRPWHFSPSSTGDSSAFDARSRRTGPRSSPAATKGGSSANPRRPDLPTIGTAHRTSRQPPIATSQRGSYGPAPPRPRSHCAPTRALAATTGRTCRPTPSHRGGSRDQRLSAVQPVRFSVRDSMDRCPCRSRSRQLGR